MTVTNLTKEDAEIQKLVAEAKAAEAAVNSSVLEQAKLKEEARKVAAEADQATFDAAIRKITLAERSRMEDLAVVQDHYVHHHFFDGYVGEKSVFGCLNTLAAWHRTEPNCDMDITINSPGGSVIDGMHLFDQITAYSLRGGGTHKVTITVRGYAASMAGILLQAADVRLIGPESYLMIHEISAGTGGKIGEIKDDVKWYQKLCDRVVDIFVARASDAARVDALRDEPLGVVGIDKEEFGKRWERHDWWLDSKEALELGFVDGIG